MAAFTEQAKRLACQMGLIDIDWDEVNLYFGDEKMEVAHAVWQARLI